MRVCVLRPVFLLIGLVALLGCETTTAQGPAIVAVELSVDFSDTAVNNDSNATAVLRNISDASVTITGSSLTFTQGANVTILDSPDSKSIGAGEDLEIPMIWEPVATGALSASLTITHNGSGGQMEVRLRGNAQIPLVETVASKDFGTAFIGGANSDTILVRNTNPVDPVVMAPSLADGTNFSIVGTPNNNRLPGGGLSSYTIEFSPQVGGPITDELILNYDGFGSPLSITLTGMGDGDPSFTAAPNPVDLGTLADGSGQTATDTISITNTGSSPGNITSIQMSATSDAGFAVAALPTFPAQISPTGAPMEQTFDIVFDESDAGAGAGTKTGTIEIAHTSQSQPSPLLVPVSIRLTGPPSFFNVRVCRLQSAGARTYVEFDIENNSANAVTISGAGLSMSNAASGTSVDVDYMVTAATGNPTFLQPNTSDTWRFDVVVANNPTFTGDVEVSPLAMYDGGNPVTGSASGEWGFITTTAPTVGNLPVPLWGGIAWNDGTSVYHIGGYDNTLTQTDIYRWTGSTWATVGQFGDDLCWAPHATVGGQLIVTGTVGLDTMGINFNGEVVDFNGTTSTNRGTTSEHAALTGAATDGTLVYTFNGVDDQIMPQTTPAIYDPIADTSTRGMGDTSGSLTEPEQQIAGYDPITGRFVVMGGEDFATTGQFVAVDFYIEYDPVTDTASNAGLMSDYGLVARDMMGVAEYNGCLILYGGLDDAGQPTDTIQVFDIENRIGSRLGITTGQPIVDSACVVQNGVFLSMGGRNSTTGAGSVPVDYIEALQLP